MMAFLESLLVSLPRSSHSRERQGVESSHLRSLSLRGKRGNHTNYFWEPPCDCTCECWGNVGIPQDMRETPNRRVFPILSHRINVLTPIL